MKHTYESIEGWFNMEKQYRKLLDHVPMHGKFVELGAWKGKSTCFLLTEAINDGIPRDIYVVDTFAGSDLTEQERIAYKGIKQSDIVKQFFSNVVLCNKLLKSVFIQDSAEAAKNFSENSVDVIFIDAGHSYESVSKDIIAWLPKMVKGGIMAGHDYNESWPGVIEAVNELLGEENINVENSCWFYKT